MLCFFGGGVVGVFVVIMLNSLLPRWQLMYAGGDDEITLQPSLRCSVRTRGPFFLFVCFFSCVQNKKNFF